MSSISSISSSMTSSIYSQGMKRPDPAQMFKKVDTDGDGGISQKELDTMAKEMANRTGQTLDTSEAITTYDTNGDSLLSQDEMGTMMMALQESMGPPPPPGSGTSPEQATAAYQANSGEDDSTSIFNSLDTNGDGVVSQDELQAMFDKMAEKIGGSSPDSKEIISSYDQDGDGALNQDEMDAMVADMKDKMEPPRFQGSGTSPEQVAATYQANSDSTDTLAVLLDLMDRYASNISTDSVDDAVMKL